MATKMEMPETEADDSDIISEVLAGDRHAFSKIVRKYGSSWSYEWAGLPKL